MTNPSSHQSATSPIRRLALIAAALLLSVPAAGDLALAVEPNVYIAPSIWLSKLSGDAVTAPGGPSSQIDWQETLGIDTRESVSSFEGFIRLGRSRFLLGLEDGNYDGRRLPPSTITFGNRTFGAGGDLISELSYHRRRALFGRPIAADQRLSIGFLVGFESYRIETKLQMARPVGPGSRTVVIDSKIPILGASVTFYPVRSLRIYGQVTGMSMDRGGVDSRLVSAYAGMDYAIIGDFLAVSLGYRYSILEGRDEDALAEFKIRQIGTFTGLVFRL